MFVSVDANTSIILQCNQPLVTELDYSREEVIGQHISYVYHPDCEEARKKVYYEAFVNAGRVHNAELQLKRKDGRKVDVILNISSARDDQGNVLYIMPGWLCITDGKKAEENIKRINESLEQLVFERTKKLKEYNAKLLKQITKHELAEERSKTILRTALDCFWIVDIQGRILEVNDTKLTSRELEICNMVKNGLTNKEMARLLNISQGTTERHRYNIRRKLGIVNKQISLSYYLKTI